MKMTAYVYPGWNPRIRPASSRKRWMDETPESFAYRCLPLKIGNEHGWEILSPCGFEATWDGGTDVKSVVIRPDPGTAPHDTPVSLFGQGTVTFHVQAILRTPSGWNLWLGGPPNQMKDGIVPLVGIIETDWSPYTFTMNWRFSRPDHCVRFEQDEPIGFFFPVERQSIQSFEASISPIESEPGLKTQFESWSASRDEFQQWVTTGETKSPSEKWQKLYHRGLKPDQTKGAHDHQTRLHVCPFEQAKDTNE
jgi:hypothetical protein